MKYIAYIGFVMIFLSCGGSKKVATASSEEDLTAVKLVEEYYSNTLDYTTFEARTRARFTSNGDTKPTVTVQIRIKKDQTIWIDGSLIGLSGARALITPDNIKFYDKLNRQYFDKDFSFISNYLGIDLNFDQLQRLLTGQTIYDLRDGRYTFTKEQDYFTVTPKKGNPLFDLLFEISTQPFTVQKQEVVMKEDQRTLYLNYGAYAAVEGKPFPTQLNLLATEPKRTTQVDIEYKSVKVNEPVRFPFKMPSGYEEIVIDEK